MQNIIFRSSTCLIVSFLVNSITPSFAVASMFSAEINDDASAGVACPGSPGSCSVQTQNTGLISDPSISLPPINASYSNGSFSGTASVSAASIQYGAMDASVSASVVSGLGGAVGQFVGEWNDTVTVTSSTLALGSPVSLLFSLSVDTASSCSGPTAGASVGATLNISTAQISSTSNCASLNQTKTLLYATSVGAHIAINDNLTLIASAGGVGGVGSATIDPSSAFAIASETPGAAFAAASGANYLPVPVPATMSLMLSGLGWLGVLKRRSRITKGV
jgi:hypothetical protein